MQLLLRREGVGNVRVPGWPPPHTAPPNVRAEGVQLPRAVPPSLRVIAHPWFEGDSH